MAEHKSKQCNNNECVFYHHTIFGQQVRKHAPDLPFPLLPYLLNFKSQMSFSDHLHNHSMFIKVRNEDLEEFSDLIIYCHCCPLQPTQFDQNLDPQSSLSQRVLTGQWPVRVNTSQIAKQYQKALENHHTTSLLRLISNCPNLPIFEIHFQD